MAVVLRRVIRVGAEVFRASAIHPVEMVCPQPAAAVEAMAVVSFQVQTENLEHQDKTVLMATTAVAVSGSAIAVTSAGTVNVVATSSTT